MIHSYLSLTSCSPCACSELLPKSSTTCWNLPKFSSHVSLSLAEAFFENFTSCWNVPKFSQTIRNCPRILRACFTLPCKSVFQKCCNNFVLQKGHPKAAFSCHSLSHSEVAKLNKPLRSGKAKKTKTKNTQRRQS